MSNLFCTHQSNMNKPKNQGKVFIDKYPILHYTKCIYEYYLGKIGYE